MSDNGIIAGLLVVLALICGLAYFFKPADNETVRVVVHVLELSLTTIMGYKFGRSMPQQANDPKAGQSAQTEIKTKIETAPEPTTEKPVGT